MSDASPEVFTLPLVVETADIDVLGHVNNVVYLRWVQDVAIAHWRAAATPEQQRTLVWVVVRHEIDYRHPARMGDPIVARTRVGVATRRTFERLTEIVRGDGRMLAQARTLWCPLDPATGRPTLVDDAVRARFSIPGADAGAG